MFVLIIFELLLLANGDLYICIVFGLLFNVLLLILSFLFSSFSPYIGYLEGVVILFLCFTLFSLLILLLSSSKFSLFLLLSSLFIENLGFSLFSTIFSL